MTTTQLHEGIRDINLSYLMLAQQMVRADKSAAVYRLGLSQVSDRGDWWSDARANHQNGQLQHVTVWFPF